VSRIISKLTSDHHQDWDEYVYKKQASIYHDSRWSQLITKAFGHESHYLMAVENEKVVKIFPLVRLKSLLFGIFLISIINGGITEPFDSAIT